jgi:hypothetical protein
MKLNLRTQSAILLRYEMFLCKNRRQAQKPQRILPWDDCILAHAMPLLFIQFESSSTRLMPEWQQGGGGSGGGGWMMTSEMRAVKPNRLVLLVIVCC